MRPRDVLVALAVMAIWGCNFPISKIGVSLWPPMFLIAVRFLVTAAILLPFVAVPRGRMGRILAASFILGFLHFAFMFTGLEGTTGSVAALAVQVQVAFSALIAAFVYKDYLGWRRTLGMVCAFGGVALLAGQPDMAGQLFWIGLIVAASLFWAIGNIMVKEIQGVGPMALTAWLSLLSSPQLFLASALLEDGQIAALTAPDWRGWAVVAYSSVAITIFGYGQWWDLMGRYPVNVIVPFTLLVPVIGVISSVAVLGDAVTAWMVAGAVLTIGGVAIIVVRRPAHTAPRQPRL